MDQLIKSQLLYQLSYRGVILCGWRKNDRRLFRAGDFEGLATYRCESNRKMSGSGAFFFQ